MVPSAEILDNMKHVLFSDEATFNVMMCRSSKVIQPPLSKRNDTKSPWSLCCTCVCHSQNEVMPQKEALHTILINHCGLKPCVSVSLSNNCGKTACLIPVKTSSVPCCDTTKYKTYAAPCSYNAMPLLCKPYYCLLLLQ